MGVEIETTDANLTAPEPTPVDEVNLEALSEQGIEGLLGDEDAALDGAPDPWDAMR